MSEVRREAARSSGSATEFDHIKPGDWAFVTWAVTRTRTEEQEQWPYTTQSFSTLVELLFRGRVVLTPACTASSRAEPSGLKRLLPRVAGRGEIFHLVQVTLIEEAPSYESWLEGALSPYHSEAHSADLIVDPFLPNVRIELASAVPEVDVTGAMRKRLLVPSGPTTLH